MEEKRLNEIDLLDNKSLREECIGNIEVLEKVGALNVLPFIEMATIEYVADFYGVSKKTIDGVITRNKEELLSDGYSTWKQSKVLKFLNLSSEALAKSVGKTVVDVDGFTLEIPNRGLRLFTKRSVLRIGMLLQESPVALKLRNLLLDVYEDVEQNAKHILEKITLDMLTTSQLERIRMKALDEKDYKTFTELTQMIDELKEKDHQAKMKNEQYEEVYRSKQSKYQEYKRQHGETSDYYKIKREISEIVRKVADVAFDGDCRVVFNFLHDRVLDYLGINVRSRVGEGSMISKYTFEELQYVLMVAKEMQNEYCK